MTAAPKVQSSASKVVERRQSSGKKEREILQRPVDDESEDDVDFISWEIYKENLKTIRVKTQDCWQGEAGEDKPSDNKAGCLPSS